jgi:uncharacterized protein (UPF0332 family)
MKAFNEYLKEAKVKKKQSDPAEARSLMQQAKERFADLKTLPLTEQNASFRFEDAYECLKEALHSFLSLEGYKPYSHEAIFAFVREQKILPEADAIRANRYREIRNDINYRAKKVTKDEAEEIITFVKDTLPKTKEKLLEKMQ